MKNRVMTCAFPVYVVLMALVYTGAADQVKADKELSEDASDTTSNMLPDTPNPPEEDISMPETMTDAMQEFRSTAELARKHAREGVIPSEEVEIQYAKMAQMMEDILNHMYNAKNAYSFLRAKGLNTIIAPNLHINYPQLRIPLLQVIRALFDIMPTTTANVIPNNILDRMVDIYERDDDTLVKTHAIDILSIWLPGNPAAQVRVMKMKGFDPFYKQLAKLETPVTKKTLELFNTLIDEHMEARNKKIQKSKADYKVFQMYQQLGLIERLSTPMMCNGLLQIFQDTFSFDFQIDILPPILKLFQTIKLHCYKVFYSRPEVDSLIDEILKYVQEPTKRAELEEISVNVTEVVENLTDFAKLVKKKPHNEL